MYACMYVRMYVFIYPCMYICMSVCIYTCSCPCRMDASNIMAKTPSESLRTLKGTTEPNPFIASCMHRACTCKCCVYLTAAESYTGQRRIKQAKLKCCIPLFGPAQSEDDHGHSSVPPLAAGGCLRLSRLDGPLPAAAGQLPNGGACCHRHDAAEARAQRRGGRHGLGLDGAIPGPADDLRIHAFAGHGRAGREAELRLASRWPGG